MKVLLSTRTRTVLSSSALLFLPLLFILQSFNGVTAGIYPQGLLSLLKQQYPDYQPNAVVDIGANVGAWAHRVRVNYPDAKLLLLEATPKHEAALQAKCQEMGQAEYQIVVLSGTTGDTVDFFQDGDTGNSMMRENSKHYQNAKSVTRTTIRLDDVIQQSPLLRDLPAIDFIKADVQGAELLVLEGGTETLSKASFVQLETSLIEYNAGGACFHDIDAFLRSQGFYLYEMSDMQRNNPAFKTLGIGQFDVLYVNPSSPRLPPSFLELNGQYCGMNQVTTNTDWMSDNAAKLLDKYGMLELEQAMEQQLNAGKGKWKKRLMSVVFGTLVFYMGVRYGTYKANRKPAKRRR